MSSNLKTTYFYAPYSYVGVIGTNIDSPTQQSAPRDKILFAATRTSPSAAETDETGSQVNVIDVPEGASVFTGGVGNWQDGDLSGCWMQVQQPNGAYLNVATPTNASGQVVLLPTQPAPANSVMAFAVINPTPGSWRVTIGKSDSVPQFQAIATTIPQMMPGQKPIVAMEEALYAVATTPGVWEQTSQVSRAAESWNWECDSCQVVGYGVALLIAAAVAAASTAILTAESAAVVTTAGFLGITAPAALALIAGLITGATLTADFVLTNLCTWVGACD